MRRDLDKQWNIVTLYLSCLRIMQLILIKASAINTTMTDYPAIALGEIFTITLPGQSQLSLFGTFKVRCILLYFKIVHQEHTIN